MLNYKCTQWTCTKCY